MSFRARLTLFFVLIVVVPMVSLTLVLFGLIADNENGKADARINARQETAIRLFEEARTRGAAGAQRVGADVALASALQRGEVAAARRRAAVLLTRLKLKRIVVEGSGRPRLDVGARVAVFPVRRALQDAQRRPFGSLEVSAQGPRAYAGAVRRLTGVDVVLRRGRSTLTSTLPSVRASALPARRATVDAGGDRYRAVTFRAPGWEAERDVDVTVLTRVTGTSDRIARSRMVVGAILLGFFLLAAAFAALVSRSLQGQVARFLEATRRIGRGDLSVRVPTVGHDEFASLGQEFNRMSAELELRLGELRSEQARVASAMRQIGRTAAVNLDRDGLLEVVVDAAVDGTGATSGRARDGSQGAHAVTSGSFEGLEAVLAMAEEQALRTGEPADVELDGRAALAHPLTDGTGGAASGILAVARRDRGFSATEQDLFRYLARQAAVSLENVRLHEAVEHQAVTDELTGLSNRRRFETALDIELGRSRRFGEPMALVLLDIDDFKLVNDTHGHAAGDAALRAVGEVLRDCSREIDEPARYGGEELAVVLPGTDWQGAYNLAERVRLAVEALRVPLPEGEGLRLTVSLGTASHPPARESADVLVNAADGALYEAKRQGKNRTVSAHGVARA